MGEQMSEANARLIEIVDGWAIAEECDLPLDRLEKLLNAARTEGPHPESGEDREIIDDLMQGFADPCVNKLTARAAAEIARLDAALAARPVALKGEALPVAWRVKDYADGWIHCATEAEANSIALGASGSRIEPLYARPCTCHPDDNPPVPCAGKFALSECILALLSRGEG